MQSNVLQPVTVTPSEVNNFYNEIPKDSLPYYNAEVELGQIVIFPVITAEDKKLAYDYLAGIREEIMNGARFKTKAFVESEDEGSRREFGDLGMRSAGDYVPEFSAAAMLLKKDEVSPIIETKYGYHIIQMVERKGDMIQVRHILIKPKISDIARQNAISRLDSLRKVLISDTVNFERLAMKFSEDQESAKRGGLIIDYRTNSSLIEVTQLSTSEFAIVDKLKIGGESDPMPFISADGREAFRIFHLKAKTPPHVANLKDDYAKIKAMALEDKKDKALKDWIEKYMPLTYVFVDRKYRNCEEMKPWTVKVQ